MRPADSTKKRKPRAEWRDPIRGELTDARLQKLQKKPPALRTDIWDKLTPGLAARVSPKGRVTWNLVSRTADQRAFRMKLGVYPIVPLRRAREEALAALRLVADERDPRRERKQRRADERDKRENTLRKAVEEYAKRKMLKIDDKTGDPRRRTGADVVAMLHREFVNPFPPADSRRLRDLPKRAGLGDLPLSEITWEQIHARVEAAEDRGAVSQSYQILASMKGLLNWAMTRPAFKLERNVCAGRTAANAIEGERETGQRDLTEVELRALWPALSDCPQPFADIARLLAITGQRRGDVANARGTEIDLRNRTWVVPGRRYKNKKDHLVPLSPQAIAILERLPNIGTDKFIFTTGNGSKPFGNFGATKSYLDDVMAREMKKSGQSFKPWKLHDLRRTAKTRLDEMAVPEQHSEAVLGHVKEKLVGTYSVHQFRSEKSMALQLWARRLDDIVAGSPKVQSTDDFRTYDDWLRLFGLKDV